MKIKRASVMGTITKDNANIFFNKVKNLITGVDPYARKLVTYLSNTMEDFDRF